MGGGGGRGGGVDTSIYHSGSLLLRGMLFAGEVEAGEGGEGVERKEVWRGPLFPGKPVPCRRQ